MGATAKLLGGSVSDPLVYIAAALFLCVVSVIATWLPARRAASIDPMKTLRME
jgi:ABC-type lipoprotein release transport system permease subunit